MNTEPQSLPPSKLTLHWQRLTIVVASIVGISSLFLPWVHFSTGETITQTGEDSAITAALFLLPFAVALIGARTPPLSVAARWFTVIPGGLLVAYAVARGIFTRDIFLSTAGQSPVAQEVARSTSAGIGPFVCFFAGAAIVIVSFLASRQKQPPSLSQSLALPPLAPLVRQQASKVVTPRWVYRVAVFVIVFAVAGYIIYKNWDAISETVSSATQAMREASGVKRGNSKYFADIAKAKQTIADAKTDMEKISATGAMYTIETKQSKHEEMVSFWRGLGHDAAEAFRKLWIWALILFSIGALWIRKRIRAGDRMAPKE